MPLQTDSGAAVSSAYALRNVLVQAPEKVKQTVLAVLGCGVIYATARGYTVDGAFVAAFGIAVERVLDLFYVAPVRTAQAAAAAEAHEQDKADVALKGIELGKQLAAQPAPGPQPEVSATPASAPTS